MIPSETLTLFSQRFIVKEFKNRDGEGVVATVTDTNNQSDISISCGNDKLMKSQGISFAGVRNFPL